MLTVAPVLAVPFTLGVVLALGEAGSVPVTTGTAGGSSWV